MRKFTIKEGDNNARYFPKFHFKKNRLVFDFIFNENCAYDIKSKEQFDWCGLAGFVFGLKNKKNLYRIGWRYDVMSKRIELSHYYYNHKKRQEHYVCAIEINQQCRAYINFDRSSNTIWTRITAIIDGQQKELYSDGVHFDFSKVPTWGRRLFFSFGQDKTAPHNMDALIQQIA